MATPGNPMQSAAVQAIIQKLAGGGAPQMGIAGGAAPTGPSPDASGMLLGQAVQQLDGANPDGLAEGLKQVRSFLTNAYMQAALRMPAAAPHISKANEAVEKAMQEVMKVSQTLNAVKPIVNSAGVGPMAGAGGSPDLAAIFG